MITDRAPERPILPVWLSAVLSQIIGIFAGFVTYVGWVNLYGEGPDIAPTVVFAGLAASLVGHKLFRLPIWWVLINAVFLPALWVGYSGQWPGWIFGALFLATLLVFWNVVRDRVPLYLSNEITARAVAGLADTMPIDNDRMPRFCDLGSGPGGLCIGVGDVRPNWQCVGYESAPVLFVLSALRASFRHSDNVTFVRRDFWSQNLAGFDIVYAFLSPAPMSRLYAKAKAEMRPGSLFISNSFKVPEATPDEIMELDDRRKTRLLIWRF